jgi:hypothetical protein
MSLPARVRVLARTSLRAIVIRRLLMRGGRGLLSAVCLLVGTTLTTMKRFINKGLRQISAI